MAMLNNQMVYICTYIFISYIYIYHIYIMLNNQMVEYILYIYYIYPGYIDSKKNQLTVASGTPVSGGHRSARSACTDPSDAL